MECCDLVQWPAGDIFRAVHAAYPDPGDERKSGGYVWALDVGPRPFLPCVREQVADIVWARVCRYVYMYSCYLHIHSLLRK